jgi:HD-GYP domain-containing protein (c-di-GMP phosphodiesterase class II)
MRTEITCRPADNEENMRLIATRRLEDGMVVGRDVMTGRHGSVPLLRRGMRIDSRYVTALGRAGIHAIYVEDTLGAGIEVTPVLTEATRAEATRRLEHSLGSVQRAKDGTLSLSDTAITELSNLARMIATELATCDDAVVALQDLGAADAYTMQHSIDVAAVGLLVGRRLMVDMGWIDYKSQRRFDRIDQRVVQLGLGLLLHDVGKLAVPQEILTKTGKLDADEWELMRQHPLTGIDMVANTQISAVARTVIRSHHERWDGSGYPEALRADKIHQYARVAAVADVYDAVTSERPYSAARPPHVGWQVIVQGSGTLFDREVVAAFRRVVAPHPPGTEIVLPDGSRGIVVSVDPEAPEEPLVRVAWAPDGTPIEPYEHRVGRLTAAA